MCVCVTHTETDARPVSTFPPNCVIMWAIGPLCTPVIQWHAHTHQPSYLGSRLTSPHPLMPHFITLLSDGLSPFIFFPHIWLLFYLLFSLFFHFILLSLPVSLMLYFLTLFMFSDCSLVLLLCILYAAIHPSLWFLDLNISLMLFMYFTAFYTLYFFAGRSTCFWNDWEYGEQYFLILVCWSHLAAAEVAAWLSH